MTLGCACHFGDAATDLGLGDDELGLAVVVAFRIRKGFRDDVQIVAIDRDDIEAVSFITLCRVFALRDVGHRIESHII